LEKQEATSFRVVILFLNELVGKRFFHPALMVLVSDLGNEHQPLHGFVLLLPVSELLILIWSLPLSQEIERRCLWFRL
jgi:hypothetical protein